MDNIKKEKFDIVEWKKRAKDLIEENPETRKMTGVTEFHTNQGNLCVVTIKKNI